MRKVDVRAGATYGTVTTLAGQAGVIGHQDGIGANAIFSGVQALADDRKGGLITGGCFPDFSGSYPYVRKGCVVRRLDLTTLAVTTIAGQPYPAIGFAAGSTYADGPVASAVFGLIFGVAVDDAGGIYVGDIDYSLLRYIGPAWGASPL